MKIGLTCFVTDYTLDIVSLARHAERLGFESLFVPEHPIIPVEMKTPFPGNAEGILPEFYKHTLDPFVGLAAAAGATERIRLGTAICLVPERHPLHTAKEVASLDVVSGGRFEFGIGTGWLEDESEVFGVDFPLRWRQTREFIEAMKSCWTEDPSEYHGEYIDFPKLWSHPKPVQKPYPPILIGGETEQSFRRLANWGDGWMPRARSVDPAGVEAGRKRLGEMFRERGRDPEPLQISVFAAPPDAESNRRFADAGADRVMHLLPSEAPEKGLQMLEEWAAALL